MVATPTKKANVSSKHCFVCGGDVFVLIDGKIVTCYTLLVNQPYFFNILQQITAWSKRIQHDDESKICKKCMNILESIKKHEESLRQRKSELKASFDKHWFGKENLTSSSNSPIRLKRVNKNEISQGKKTRLVNTQTPKQATKTTSIPSCVTAPSIQTQALKMLIPKVNRIASKCIETQTLKTGMVPSSLQHVNSQGNQTLALKTTLVPMKYIASTALKPPPLKTTLLIPSVQHSTPQVMSHRIGMFKKYFYLKHSL